MDCKLYTRLLLNIFKLCIKNKINLLLEWVPRDDNVTTDLASKNVDRDDFMLYPDIFTALDIYWGAQLLLTELVLFIRDSCQGLHVTVIGPILVPKVLSFNWDNENNWLFPPSKLIPRVLQHLAFSKAEVTLIVQIGLQSIGGPWFIRGKVASQMKLERFWLLNHPRKNTFLPVAPEFSLFDDDIPTFNILALRICC